MKIKIATKKYSEEVVEFFEKNLNKENKAIYSREFFCPFGVRAAINRNQIIILLDNEKVVGAIRFYPQKNNKIVSLYQFALDKKYRGEKWMEKILNGILKYTKYDFIKTQCLNDIEFNNYYKKIGFEFVKKDDKFKYWVWKK